MFRSDGLYPTLDGHSGFVFLLLTGACPLGTIIVDQLSHPVSKSDLNVTIKGSYWKKLLTNGERERKRERGRERERER